MSTHEDKVGLAVHAIAKRLYDMAAPKSDPPFEAAPDMVRYRMMEVALMQVQMVLDHFEPVPPDYGVLVLRMELLAQELEPRRQLSGAEAAAAIRELVTEAQIYGTPKEI